MPYYTTPPLEIEDLPADARHITPGRLDPTLIVLHSTQGVDSRLWLSTDPNSVVSVQRLIRDQEPIYKIADDLVICNHVGGSAWYGLGWPKKFGLNPYALGIELENRDCNKFPFTDDQYRKCVQQCVEWRGKYGPLPIVGHGTVDKTSGKTDPGSFFNWRYFWSLMRQYTPHT